MLNRIMSQLHDNGLNSRLELIGVVMTMFDSRTISRNRWSAKSASNFGDRVFENHDSPQHALAEAPSFGKPIIHIRQV